MWKQLIRNVMGESVQIQVPQPEPVVIVAKPTLDFSDTFGNDPQKEILRDAYFAPKSISVLLYGPPGGNKSGMMHTIEIAVGEYGIFLNGTSVTKAGLEARIKEKFEELKAKYGDEIERIWLFIDEIEKADLDASEVLLNIIEGGRLTKTLANQNKSYDYQNVDIAMIATCNNFEKLVKEQKPLVSRIVDVEVPIPDLHQFMGICAFRLEKENIPQDLAWYIAAEVYKVWGIDVREAVKIGKMCKSAQDVDRHIANRKKTGAGKNKK